MNLVQSSTFSCVLRGTWSEHEGETRAVDPVAAPYLRKIHQGIVGIFENQITEMHCGLRTSDMGTRGR